MSKDRRELGTDETMVFTALLEAMGASMWSAMPARVTSFNASRMTCELVVAIQARVRLPNGEFQFVDVPPLVDCPVLFPGGGGYTLTFPVAAGDEALVVFASRCIDSWWDTGSAVPQPPSEFRMHDLSDGFALIGPRSRPRALSPAVLTDGVELRSNDRTSRVTMGPAGAVSVIATGTLRIQAPTIQLVGNVDASGGTLTHNGVNVGFTHRHAAGSPNTGTPF